jgi:hypothetical protein
MGFENVGRSWTPESLKGYLATLTPPAWCRAVTLHHTAEPSLAQRPNGLTIRHIENMRDFYQNTQKWRSGPHLFADEDQLFGMSDFRRQGVHAVSFNRSAIGIEVLGNYDAEDPLSGRGLLCWQNSAGAARVLLEWLGLAATADTVLLHRDDPQTRKSCPGRLVKKEWLLELIGAPVSPPTTETEKPGVGFPWTEWEFHGQRWCVPVRNFLVARGVPQATVLSNLKSRGGKTYYGTELLEGAYYVAATGTTWAPVQELMELA